MKIRHSDDLKLIIPINFFSVYNGHGGDVITEELKENLHKHLVYSKWFFEDPIELILQTFHNTE